MVRPELGFVRLQNAAQRLTAAQLDGGGDMVNKFGIFDGWFLRGIIGERSGVCGARRESPAKTCSIRREWQALRSKN